MKRKFAYLFLATCYSFPFVTSAQTGTGLNGGNNVPTSAVPFLNFTPDARSGALGDAGVALDDADASAVFWNPAKLIFANQNSGGVLSYTPWLRNLIGDMYYTNLSAYGKVSKNTAIAGSLLYFDLGTVDFTSNTGVAMGTFNSREYAFTATVSQKLSQNLALALNLKYLNSNLAAGSTSAGLKPGATAAADISIYYHNEARDRSTGQGLGWGFGAMISNIGGKLNYGGTQQYFIPTNLRLGTGLTYYVDQYNKFNFVLDVNKLMVPTPNVQLVNGVQTDLNADKNYFSAIFGSFGDAPGGFSEELKEFTISTGIEYWYNNAFAARIGYFNESNQKGGRKYLTTGIGLRLQQRYGIDFSYLVPVKQDNPLKDTFRISLVMNLSGSNRIGGNDVSDDN